MFMTTDRIGTSLCDPVKACKFVIEMSLARWPSYGEHVERINSQSTAFNG
jgi:hypothetical protein